MSDLFTETTSQILMSGRVKTSSRLYMTWLSSVRGFKIEKKVQTPKGYSFGRLTYKTSWILRRKKEEVS